MTEALAPSQGAASGDLGDTVPGIVLALCRLIEVATMEAPVLSRSEPPPGGPLDKQIEETVAALREHGRRTGQGASVLFAHGAIFVNGRLMRARRDVYERCLGAGQVLDRCGIAEIALARDVFPADLRTLASLLGEFNRCPEPVVPERITPRVRLRPINDAARRHEIAGEQQLAPEDAIVHTYASAIVLMRRFLEGLRRGRYTLPRRFKRIAQRLVDLSAGGTPAFLGVTAARNASHDDAGQAVNTAVLSLAMARQITGDSLVLQRLAMAALLYDTGKSRLAQAGAGKDDGGMILPGLSEQQEAEMPAGTAVVLTALGRLSDEGMVRTVLAYEAHWMKRQARLGPLYRGLRQPALLSRIVSVARSFNDLLTPASGKEPLTADGAIAKLEQEAESAADRTVLRLLVGALGIFPTGTLVELSTGEVALVVQTPSHPALYSQPRVRLIFDASGAPVDRFLEVDLAQAGEPPRHIRRVVATSDDASASTMRSFASAPSPIAPSSGPRPPAGFATQRSRAGGPTSGRSAPVSARGAQDPMSARSAPEPTSARAVQPPSRSRDSSEGELSSGRRSPSAPPTPPTIPASTRGGQRLLEEMRDASSSAAAPARPLSGSVEKPPTPSPQASEPTASPGPPSEGAGPVTRKQAWHAKAYLLSIEQAEAHRSPGDAPPQSRPEVPATPTAEGTLAKTPLVHLLVYMLDRRLTGSTLFLTPDGISHGIYFYDGVPSKVRTGTQIAPLDQILLELGLIDQEVLEETLIEALQRKVLHGRHLVERGLLDRETMLSVLGLQLVRKMLAYFELPSETRYAYYDGLNLLATHGGPELFPCEPLAVIMAGIRLRAHDPLVNATLDRLGNRGMLLHPDGDVRRFRFHRDEAAVAELIRGQRRTLSEILTAGVAHERTVRLTIYALTITRYLEVGVVGKPPVGVIGARDFDEPVSLRGDPFSLRGPMSQGRDAPRSGRGAAPSTKSGSALDVQGEASARAPEPTSAPASSQAATTTPSPGQPAAKPLAQPAPAKKAPDPAPLAPRPAVRAGYAPIPAASREPPRPPAALPPQPVATGSAAPRPEPRAPAQASPPSGTPASSADARPKPRTGFGLGFGQLAAKPSTQLPKPTPSAGTPSPAPTGSEIGSPPAKAAPAKPPAPPAPKLTPAARAVEATKESAARVDDDWGDVMPESAPKAPSRTSLPAAQVARPPAAQPAARPPPAAPASVKAPIDLAARRAEIEARAASIEGEDHFKVLGVAPETSSSDLQTAYFALAKIYHPDRLPSDLADLRPVVARIFAQISEAYRTLSDPTRRAEYLSSPSSAHEDPAKVARAVDAALELQKAEALLKSKDLAGAEAHARKAFEADPEQPDHISLLTWIQAQRRAPPPPLREGAVSTHYDDLIKTLDAVLAKEPRYERALFYRATLLKRSGRLERALAEFRLVAEINPRNIDAAREVRLHEMRTGGGAKAPHPSGNPEAPEGAGIINKIFKR